MKAKKTITKTGKQLEETTTSIPVDLSWCVVDDNPEELILVSLHRNKTEAISFLRMFQGFNEDSYSCQYYRIVGTAQAINRLAKKSTIP